MMSESFADEIKVKFGETVSYENLKFYFYDIEDSRCPSDVTCIWEGRVLTMTRISNATLDIGGYRNIGNVEKSFPPYVVTLKDLQPYPVNTEKPNYVATMFVWESVDNPSALSPPMQLEFTVISEHQQKARQNESGNYQEMFMFIISQDKFESFTNIDLRTLHYYKIDHQELSSLPRLGMLVNITEDFPYQPVSNLALRISDEQIEQYDLFFEQKCKEQRPYAVSDECVHIEFAFEYDDRWYYVYPKLASHHDAIEDSRGNWDPEYFTRK